MKKMENNQNGKRELFLGGTFILMFIVWTMLILTVDVQAIGVNGTEVGMAAFNSRFHELTGINLVIYTVTDWLGLVPIFVCLIFAGTGCEQLIKRRSLFKVDYDIIFLGIYYLVVILGYLIFEMYPINYRPVLIEGILEASYPSSTTLLVLAVMPTLVEQSNRRIANALAKRWIMIFAVCFAVLMIAGRLISGVHWFTDIVGACLLSAGLFLNYKGAVLWWNFTKNCRN